MDNSKYYTPEIEEFHVGFECEQRSPKLDEDHHIIGGEWKPYIMDKWCLQIDPSWIRVKYLDEEDILSLGFITSSIRNYYVNGPSFLYHLATDLITYDLFTYPDHRIHITINNFIQPNVIFEGTIRNKSELKRLLKQLGI